MCLRAPCGLSHPAQQPPAMWTLSRYKRTGCTRGAGGRLTSTDFKGPMCFPPFDVSSIVFPTEVLRVLR